MPRFDEPDHWSTIPRADEIAVVRSPEIDTTRPHSARIWNYWLGGKDNYAVDRTVGDQVRALLPTIVEQALADRAFLGRAVRYLAGEQRIRQFLDIGTGLPTVDNTHEVAQALDPTCRIVYVDNDPLVLSHARALLTSTPEGRCDYLQADLHDPDFILYEATRTLDFTRPIGLMLLGVMHHITDTSEAYAIGQHLVEALPAGSFVAINHATNAVHGAASDKAAAHWNTVGQPSLTLRSPEEIARFFAHLELVEPGIVSCSHWRPDPGPRGEPDAVDEFCGVGRRP